METRSEQNTKMVSALVEQTVSMSARVDQTTNMLVDILSKLDKDKEELQEDKEEVEVNIEDIEEEQEETQFDIQKVGRMVESNKNFVYISMTAFALWKVFWTTWKHCTPTKQDDWQFVHPIHKQENNQDTFHMD